MQLKVASKSVIGLLIELVPKLTISKDQKKSHVVSKNAPHGIKK